MNQPTDYFPNAFLVDLLKGVVLPIFVSAVTTLVFGLLNEGKRKRGTSLLGVAIIESLQEEVRNGISIMTEQLETIKRSDPNPLSHYLPSESWQGVATIPNDVLLQLRDISKDRRFSGFAPSEIQMHCKNYFRYMCTNYNNAVNNAREGARKGYDWKPIMLRLLDPNQGHFIESAQQVYQLLEDSKALLAKNAKARFPK